MSIKDIAQHMAAQGRFGDTMLVHINPKEAAMLKSMGGAGTINPHTGLPEYWGLRSFFSPVTSAFNSIVGGLEDLGQGAINTVKSVGSQIDDTVNKIPGGWGTVAAATGVYFSPEIGAYLNSAGNQITEAEALNAANQTAATTGGATVGAAIPESTITSSTLPPLPQAPDVPLGVTDYTTAVPMEVQDPFGYTSYDVSQPAGYDYASGAPTDVAGTDSGMIYGQGEGAFPGAAEGTVASDIAGTGIDTGIVGGVGGGGGGGGAFVGKGGGGGGGGSGGGTGLTGMGALAGGLGLAGLLKLMQDDASRFGTPGRASYSGPLTAFKFNPATYQPSIPDPSMFRPSGVTTVADQFPAAPRPQTLPPAQNPLAQIAAVSDQTQKDPVEAMDQLSGIGAGLSGIGRMFGFAKGGNVSDKPKYTAKSKLATMDPWSRAAAEYQNNAYMAQSPVAPVAAPAVQPLGQLNLSGGGLGSYSDGGHMLRGPGDGMSDSIPATIGGKRPARLADGEFVVPADVVSHLGNGSTEAGARELYKMMDKVRHARTGRKDQGKQINPGKFMPK